MGTSPLPRFARQGRCPFLMDRDLRGPGGTTRNGPGGAQRHIETLCVKR